MSRANNTKSARTAIAANTGAWVEVFPEDTARSVMLLSVPATQPAVNVCIGFTTPTEAASFTMVSGSALDMYHAPIGPVYVRSDTTAVSELHSMGG